jgi:hypothetical protein
MRRSVATFLDAEGLVSARGARRLMENTGRFGIYLGKNRSLDGIGGGMAYKSIEIDLHHLACSVRVVSSQAETRG